ncbi:hypothetical protein PV-S19_0084 [Pacmanvirus S19]|nr:hypothetical protein PV-S19_0084 [Pacmanvirus S19]
MSDDIATQKLNELRQKAKEKFTDEEIDSYISVGKKLASKPVLSMVICMLKEKIATNGDKTLGDKLVRKIEKRMPYNYCGYVSLGFKETSMKLNICLSLVDRDYKTDISIPSNDYVRALFEQYDFLKQTAAAYWRQFCEEFPELSKEICDYLNDTDLSNLRIDPMNPTTMYFNNEAKKRVGLFCYYTDASGRPWYKKTNKNSKSE